MKSGRTNCAGYAERISLFVSDALPDSERAAIEEHLATCECCRAYYAELGQVAADFAHWENEFSRIEPSASAELRWRRAIETVATKSPKAVSGKPPLHDWWRELVWSCRYAWGGMAALWIVLVAMNSRLSDGRSHTMANRDGSVPSMAETIAEQRQLLTELIPAQPQPRREASAVAAPKPRSEREAVWKIV